MKVSAITFFLILSLSQLIQAQGTFRTILMDDEGPVIYANVSIKGSKIGTVSNLNGYFSIDYNMKEDTLLVSSIGYETLSQSFTDVMAMDTLWLQSVDYEIEEISITESAMDKDVQLGEKNKKGRGTSVGFGSAQLGTEIGTAIKVEQETYVKSINFVLNHAKADSLLFRAHIYSFRDGKIGDRLLNQNVYLKEKQRKGLYTIDISEYNIVVDQDVFVSLEWLKNFDSTGNKYITFDTKKSKSLRGIYFRYNSHMDFQKLKKERKRKPCIFLLAKQSYK